MPCYNFTCENCSKKIVLTEDFSESVRLGDIHPKEVCPECKGPLIRVWGSKPPLAKSSFRRTSLV